MATQYGGVYVDEKYSAILEPNLYGDAIFQPNKTFNNQYQGDANSGLVKIFKTTRDAAAAPSTPAGDFDHENAANAIIDLRLNNAYRKSKKIYKVAANAVPYNLAEEHLSTAVKDNQEDIAYSALACLASEGIVIDDREAVTADNLKAKILAVRKQLRRKKAKADTAIASVDVYSLMLEVAGTQYTPSTNENTLTTGRVGQWLGFTWYEGDLLDAEQAKYYNYAGDLVTADLTDIDLIIYDHNAFHMVLNLEAMRIIDSEDFVGSYAQNEINMGFRVSNALKVAVKKNTELDSLSVESAAGTASGTTALTVTPGVLAGHSYVYKTHATTAPAVTYDEVLNSAGSWTAWDGLVDIAGLTAGHKITVAEIVTTTKKAKKAGSATVVVNSGG